MSLPFSVNRSGAARYRIVNDVAIIGQLKSGQFITGEQGITDPVNIGAEAAWSAIMVWGNLDGATIKFQISAAQDGKFFDYPAEAAPEWELQYPYGGLTQEGVFPLGTLLGNNFARFEWTAAGANADFWVAAIHQVV